MKIKCLCRTIIIGIFLILVPSISAVQYNTIIEINKSRFKQDLRTTNYTAIDPALLFRIMILFIIDTVGLTYIIKHFSNSNNGHTFVISILILSVYVFLHCFIKFLQAQVLMNQSE